MRFPNILLSTLKSTPRSNVTLNLLSLPVRNFLDRLYYAMFTHYQDLVLQHAQEKVITPEEVCIHLYFTSPLGSKVFK